MFLFISLCKSFTPSRFGTPSATTVSAQYVDYVEAVEEIHPPYVRHIREAYFTEEIPDDDYPWPGHPNKANVETLTSQTNQIYENYCKPRIEMTQDDLFYHPAGVKQFKGDEEKVKKYPRYKFKVKINTKQKEYHWTAIYAPPGELITVEIPEAAVNNIYLNLNIQSLDAQNYNERLMNLSCQFKLTNTTNKFGWPYGGSIDILAFVDNFPYGLEMTISGGMKMPYFQYGVTDERTWEEEISRYPAPLAVIDAGNLVAHMPSYLVRNLKRLNDALALWRTAGQVLYSVNDVYNFPRGDDGRMRTPVMIKYDSQFRDVAYSYVGFNFIVMPTEWFDPFGNYENAVWGCWAILHEYGHQFQKNWGFGDYIEVTNNVLSLISYSKFTEIDSTRQVSLGGDFYVKNGGWGWTTHVYNTIEKNELLTFYGNFLYYFGSDAWRKCLYAHIHDVDYNRTTFNYISQFLLHCCKYFNRDLRNYFLSFNNLIVPENISKLANDTIDQMKLKEFYPVANLYQTGYVIDGKEIETEKPFQIPVGENYVFDFVKYMRQRTHQFKFINVTGGEGKFEKIEEGKYLYKPTDKTKIDKFYVNYQDLNNSDITTVIVRVKQVINGSAVRFIKLDKEKSFNDAVDYLKQNENKAITLINYDSLSVPYFDRDQSYTPWVAVCDGAFVPPETGKYTFYLKHHEKCRFYLSENPILDLSKNMLAEFTSSQESFDFNHKTNPMNLEKNKKYFFKFIVMNSNGKGGGEVKYSFGDNTNEMKTITFNQQIQVNANVNDNDTNIFIPQLEEDPLNNLYMDDLLYDYDTFDFKVISHPLQEDLNVDLNQYLFNREQHFANVATHGPSPLKYEIDLGKYLAINGLDLESMRSTLGNISVKCQGKEIYHDVYNYRESEFFFDRAYSCRLLEIDLLDNQFESLSSMTASFSKIIPLFSVSNTKNIIPATHPEFYLKGGESTKDGLYFNGVGFKMHKNANLTFKLKTNETGDCFAIIGDKSLSGGQFDVYINGEHIDKIGTSFITNAKKRLMASNTMYQVPLYGKYNLSTNTEYLVNIVVYSGEIGIAGILANGDLLPVERDPPPSPTPGPTALPNDDAKHRMLIILTSSISVAFVVCVVIVVVIIVVIRKKYNRNTISDMTAPLKPMEY